MNKNMKIFYKLGAVVLFLSLCLTGCDNFFEPPAAKTKTEGEKGLVVFRFGPAGSRTVMPDSFEFSEIELTLTPIDGEGGQETSPGDDYTKADLNGPVELLQGWWRVTSVFKAEIAGIETTIANGVEQDFLVGSSTAVTIELEFLLSSGKGTFEYDIKTEPVPEEVKISFTPQGTGTPLIITIDDVNDLSSSMTGFKNNVDAGYYLVIVTLKKQSDEAVYTEIVHIYPGQTTKLEIDLKLADYHTTVDTYTVTFDSNFPAWAPGGTAASPSTATATPPATTTVALPTTDPIYQAGGWNAGVIFDGWYTAATGGTQFLATTPVTETMTVYARWKFTPGTVPSPPYSDPLVIDAPQPKQVTGGNHGSWSAGNTENDDGSFTFASGGDYTGGGISFDFPSGIEDYDFVEIEFIMNTGTTLQLVTKILSNGDTTTPMSGGGSYFTTGGTRTFALKVIGTGIAFTRNTGGPGIVKLVKATFTKGTRHTITFASEPYTGWVKPADMTGVVAGVAIGALPAPDRVDYNFDGWFDESDPLNHVLYTATKEMPATDLDLVAHWTPAVPGLEAIEVDFSASATGLTVSGSGAPTISDITAEGFTFTWGTEGYNPYPKFTVTLPNDVTLANYGTITFVVEGIKGDCGQKPIYVAAGAPGTMQSYQPHTASNITTKTDSGNNYTQNTGEATLTFTIDNTRAATLSGTLEFGIYVAAAPDGTQGDGGATQYRFSNFKINPK
jgi:uncharacterized repeat protein (TIGR02543 family)